MATKRKKKVFNASTEVRAIARERLGRVKPTVEIVPKSERKKAKYPADLTQEE